MFAFRSRALVESDGPPVSSHRTQPPRRYRRVFLRIIRQRNAISSCIVLFPRARNTRRSSPRPIPFAVCPGIFCSAPGREPGCPMISASEPRARRLGSEGRISVTQCTHRTDTPYTPRAEVLRHTLVPFCPVRIAYVRSQNCIADWKEHSEGSGLPFCPLFFLTVKTLNSGYTTVSSATPR